MSKELLKQNIEKAQFEIDRKKRYDKKWQNASALPFYAADRMVE